jgi:hypothetical protein
MSQEVKPTAKLDVELNYHDTANLSIHRSGNLMIVPMGESIPTYHLIPF